MKISQIRLPDNIHAMLKKLSYTSGKSQNALLIEALQLLFKTPGGKK